MIMRNRFMLAAFLMIGLIAAQGCTGETPARPPNIVFILADDMGAWTAGTSCGGSASPGSANSRR